MSKVQIRRIEHYDLPLLESAVAEFLSTFRSSRMTRSKRVLLKPNLLGAFTPDRAVTTHPLVLEALIRYFLSKDKEVWIGDSPGGSVNVEQVWQTCGLSDLAARYPVKLVNLSTSGYRELEYGGISVKISEVFWQCGIVINVAKYKTHSLMAYTGALKNLYGLIPGLVKTEYHGRYPNTKDFAELLLTLYQLTKDRISYSIIDGITGMDGAGPSGGRARNFGLLMGSRSISSLDYVGAKLMGFKLQDVPYLAPALHQDGQLPSRISLPASFRDFQLQDVDIRTVKMSKDIMRFVPRATRHVFKRLYYVNLAVRNETCVKCGICVRSCPVQAISPASSAKFPKIDTEKCIRCMCCHEMCPHGAIDIHKSLLARMVIR